MPLPVQIEVVGLDNFRRIATQVRNLGEDLTPLLLITRDVLVASTLVRFETGKGPGGIPWPISKRAAGLVKGKPAGRTLVDTGDLQDSIKGEVRANEVEVGSDGLKNPIKALANQFGTSGSYSGAMVKRHTRTVNSRFGVPLPRGHRGTESVRAHIRVIPARPFIGVDDEDRSELNSLWRDHLIGLFK